MQYITFFFMVTQLYQLTRSVDGISKTQVWNTQQKLCAAQDYSCAYKVPTTDHIVIHNNDSYQGNQNSSADMTSAPACCGFCSCEADCAEYGSCCLSEYRGLTSGRKMVENAAAKYECVHPQLMTAEEMTDITYARGFGTVLMISKCSAPNVDYSTKIACETPGLNGSLESLVPVTDYITHYRNIYCARCNDDSGDIDALPRWRLQLHCMRYFKLSVGNILQQVVTNRCNIFFKPPMNSRQPRRCINYSVSRCNQTGLWTKYNETIDLACNAYIDVFNATYKNIFCLLCNTNSMNDINSVNTDTCNYPWSALTENTPLFSTMLDMNSLTTSTNDECDSEAYFNDYRKGVCRSIMCDESRKLSNHVCLLNDEIAKPLCFVLYFKLTPDDYTKFGAYTHIDTMFLRVENLLVEERSQLLAVNTYMKTRDFGPRVVSKYNVMELFVILYDTGVDIIPFLIQNYHNKWIPFNKDVKVLSEFIIASHHSYSNESTIFLSVWNNVTGVYDTIESRPHASNVYNFTASQTDRRSCDNAKPIILDHLHVCPFIRLNFSEINFKLFDNNNSLQINESLRKTTIPKWEFRIVNESVFICISTYRKIYESIRVAYAPEVNDSNVAFVIRLNSSTIAKYVAILMSVQIVILHEIVPDRE